MASEKRVLYPEIEPYRTGRLQVGGAHEIYFEESGNPNGKPVVFLHGGPGGGTEPKHRRYFDPKAYRIVLFDQRGCGRSTPFASLEDNTTWHLVEDIEKLRTHLEIEKWLVFGGSWGSTLALAYAETHPSRVTELVLRGIFLLRREEIRWFYQDGASWIFPDAWHDYVTHIPPEERIDLLRAYYARLTSDDPAVQRAAAKVWSVWEGRTSCLIPNPDLIARTAGDEFALAFARIECHYFVNDGWLTDGRELLAPANVDKLRKIPGVIVQGRYDVVCPAKSAWDLHVAWPEADFRLIADAGHAASEPGIVHELVSATDRFRP
ncbi:MAG TPA: prolyl aminopeptidase [Labilithrix sp.]|nr:prolyl aminopeptidase [Labilithrix sp.]